MNKELRCKLIIFLKEKLLDVDWEDEDGFVAKVYSYLINPFPLSWNLAKALIQETDLNNDTILELKEMVK